MPDSHWILQNVRETTKKRCSQFSVATEDILPLNFVGSFQSEGNHGDQVTFIDYSLC